MLRITYKRLEKKLLASGREAKAEVVAAQPTLNAIRSGWELKESKWLLKLRVQPPGHSEFQSDIQPWLPAAFRPRPGTTVDVLYDPKERSKVVIDPRTEPTVDPVLAAARQAAATAGPGVFVMGPGGQLTQVGAAAAAHEDPVDELQKLVDLHNRGALTDSEFAAQKSRILGSSG